MINAIDCHNEERLNVISHGLGAGLAVIGSLLLLMQNGHRTPYATFSLVVYGASLIAMFSASAWYHAVKDRTLKRRLRILDHINIYLLIAGTYTPVVLISLVDGNGWTIFYAVWAIALFGSVLKLFFTGRFEWFSLMLYLGMGWLIVLDFPGLLQGTTALGKTLLFLGGAFYTVGIVFYAWQGFRYNHFIWHLFVLMGAFSHWLFIYLDVV